MRLSSARLHLESLAGATPSPAAGRRQERKKKACTANGREIWDVDGAEVGHVFCEARMFLSRLTESIKQHFAHAAISGSRHPRPNANSQSCGHLSKGSAKRNSQMRVGTRFLNACNLFCCLRGSAVGRAPVQRARDGKCKRVSKKQ